MSASTAPRVVLLDIEGTTAPISFVHTVLFPYARTHLPRMIEERRTDPVVKDALAATERLAPDVPPLEQLERWMNEDAKVAPLKALQGMAWAEGYKRGELLATLYPDVVPTLEAWAHAGIDLAVYSSGSESAQKLIYGHTAQGDVTPLFSRFFDLRVGGKKDAESYRAILRETGWQNDDVLFLSDVTAELDAAAQAGLRVCQIVRPEDATVAGSIFPVAGTLPEAGALFGLPGTGQA
ncbi:enolase [Acetobacter indonesiensis]|uniref:acireductone synthase n=1 Tax=Acetobacter indonesiensis TaxID=104101 RepID=UPI000A3CCD40|nr:acireductone synthase [Acetobacter indonesiensis]OUI95333.1 enolase [Acetobacter indonesiensis]